MKEETKSKLQDILSRHDRRQAEAQAAAERIKSEREAFLSEFRKLRSQVIRPTMEEMGNQLKEHGHDFQISGEEESIGPEGRIRDPKITLSIFPASAQSSRPTPDNAPSISFVANQQSKKIIAHETHSRIDQVRSALKQKEFGLDQITGEAVEAVVIEVLNEIFDPR